MQLLTEISSLGRELKYKLKRLIYQRAYAVGMMDSIAHNHQKIVNIGLSFSFLAMVHL